MSIDEQKPQILEEYDRALRSFRTLMDHLEADRSPAMQAGRWAWLVEAFMELERFGPHLTMIVLDASLEEGRHGRS